MRKNNKQLNIMQMMGLRRSHWHKSIDSAIASDITIPIIDNNLQYDSPTITRVTKQFSENIERLTTYIKENAEALQTTNLSKYITSNVNDEDGIDKIFATSPCALTSKRALALKNCYDIQSDLKISQAISSFMVENAKYHKNILLIVTVDNRILRLDLSETFPSLIEVYNAATDSKQNESKDLKFIRAGYADENKLYIYIITNQDIRLFRASELSDLDLDVGTISYCNIIDVKNTYSDDNKRYNDNIIIEDIYRRKKISALISNGNFDSFVDKYFKLGEFPENVLQEEYYSTDPVNVYDIGIVTGKYGIYLIQCYSAKAKNINEFEEDNGIGSLHIRCLDNKPVKDAFFYKDNNEKFLVAINGWPIADSAYTVLQDNKYKGMTVFKINESSAASSSINVDELPNNISLNDFKVVPKDGYIQNPDHDYVKINIDQVLDSRGINGAYVNKLFYCSYTLNDSKGFIIKYKRGQNAIYWFINSTDQKLCTITKAYDRNEFNCLAKEKIQLATYYDDINTIILDIKDVGIVEGIKQSSKNNNTGFRFKIIKRVGTYEPLNAIYAMNRCFVAVSDKTLQFIISNGMTNEMTIGTDVNTNVKSIMYSCTFEASNAICIGDINENTNESRFAMLQMKYFVDATEYANMITGNISNAISTNFLSKDSKIYEELNVHKKTMHNENSIVTRMNSMLSTIQDQSISQTTGFSDNLNMSYFILNYPNIGDDFTYVETDDNTTNIYGRINSKTINSNPMLIAESKRNSDAFTYYDTILDDNRNIVLSTNKLVYSACKLSDRITKLIVNVPTTGTFYVDNILGWSGGNRTGSNLLRKNLNDGYIQGSIENCTTTYQLVLNKTFFNIKNILNVTLQLASAPLKIYSNTTEFDVRHYGMYDSPIIAPLNMNILTESMNYDLSNVANDEIILSFNIFGGDALQINILIENN